MGAIAQDAVAAKKTTVEHQRLEDHQDRRADWKGWGPYVADRAWGTVREDYSTNADPWSYFTHDHARSRAYRWNEDGIAGVCNRFQNTCIAVALWNERDPFLKERLFGLTGHEGNHGEDVKEYYFYLDSTPTHSYMRMLYKYPQVEFPYRQLIDGNRARGYSDPELELADVLQDELASGRYFDVLIEYAKAEPDDILCRITATNRGPDTAPLHLLPHIWHRNTWSWRKGAERPLLRRAGDGQIESVHRHLGRRWWSVKSSDGQIPRLLFTENESNTSTLFGVANSSPHVKDAFHDAVVANRTEGLNPAGHGTKAAAEFRYLVPAGKTATLWVRFSSERADDPFADFASVFSRRMSEADEFYRAIQPADLTAQERAVQRQAFAGMLWSKQYYHFSVELWLDGDPGQPAPPASRRTGRNADWRHLYNNDILSMPDKWEYPWFAAWDTAFHAVPLAVVDPEFAKRQLILLLREWYMHPNGAIPAYEWSFSDVNPPVHAWAAWQVYKISKSVQGQPDIDFLERIFQKLLLNFTWWVNRKDSNGNNAFQGGFLGLDNIGIFDRSAPLPTGGYLEQADGTAWMAMYCINMLGIAFELARYRPAYEDIATKFFEHFVYIANAFYSKAGRGISLWDEEDGFYYDVIHAPDRPLIPLRIRSFVGLIPLFAVGGMYPSALERLPHFAKRVQWFLKYRPHLVERVGALQSLGENNFLQIAIADEDKLRRILRRVFDETEFWSPHGLRSLSKAHEKEPFELDVQGATYRVSYEPGESPSGLFGGNSNWRGPIWFPINYLMVQTLRKYHLNYGDAFKIEVPTGSGNWVTLNQAADLLSQRLVSLFLPNADNGGQRPVHGGRALFDQDPHWRELVPFYEYFHGDSGAGLGASHQTGWTGLVARLLQGPDSVGLE